MKRKIAKYLAEKQGVAPEDLKYKEDGRFDFMGDLEGVLACIRKPKEKKYPPVRKPKEKKAPKAPKEKKQKAAPKKRKSKATKVKPPSPKKESLKVAFARKDRATMSWAPRDSEPSATTSTSEVTGASLLLSLASCSETVSPFKKQDASAPSTMSEKCDAREDENIVNAQRPSVQGSFQNIHASMESMREGVSC